MSRQPFSITCGSEQITINVTKLSGQTQTPESAVSPHCNTTKTKGLSRACLMFLSPTPLASITVPTSSLSELVNAFETIKRFGSAYSALTATPFRFTTLQQPRSRGLSDISPENSETAKQQPKARNEGGA